MPIEIFKGYTGRPEECRFVTAFQHVLHNSGVQSARPSAALPTQGQGACMKGRGKQEKGGWTCGLSFLPKVGSSFSPQGKAQQDVVQDVRHLGSEEGQGGMWGHTCMSFAQLAWGWERHVPILVKEQIRPSLSLRITVPQSQFCSSAFSCSPLFPKHCSLAATQHTRIGGARRTSGIKPKTF